MIAQMTRENRAALLKRLKAFYKNSLSLEFPKKALIYLKGSVERSKFDDDTNHLTMYEANFSYLVGLNCVYYDSLIDLSTDEVYLVDILDYYRGNIWHHPVTPEKLKEYGLKAVLNKDELNGMVKKLAPEKIFINRSVQRSESRWTHYWVPEELEEFRDLMDFDSLYPMICKTRTIKNPTELKCMKEVIVLNFFN
jgi:Xaa-Pro aminopeptidase